MNCEKIPTFPLRNRISFCAIYSIVEAIFAPAGTSHRRSPVAPRHRSKDHLQATAKSEHGGYRFHSFVRDTQLDPAKALAAIQDLDKRGVKIVIGPQSSAEVAMIKPYADAHNIL